MGSHSKNKNVTVLDVAKVAGVSKSTVSLVLTQSEKVSEKSKLKVQKAMDEIGYVYNRDAASLRSRRSNLVAIVINDLTNPYAAQLVVGLEKHISEMGLFSMIVNSGEDVERQQRLVRNLKEYNVVAFIICPAPGTTAKWTNDLNNQGFPVINIMREISGSKVPTVLPDNVNGTSLATQHLLSKGFRRIAFLGGNEAISDYHERLEGYVSAMKKGKVRSPKKYQIQSETNRHGGRQALEKALKIEPDLEAIVCFSDVVAYGAIEKMRELGKKPGKEIAVVGFDDLKDSRLMSPSLSSVKIDADKIGAATCQILKKIREQKKPRSKILVDIELIERDSSQ
ncbi:LacI family DNA-binding transcriptional regulator [Aliikangiella coralliicola]|uniref:Substrate-binding domain-containing protein n=1 Tax=Aliikangiella coralliicola TaxID=2592383 RepID=A0A545U937_9GAMM|nr:LacI family DNA-binding transcriptional regulator [Aliikangiella coralliicola]TQV85923.1 substrate-binding domain-containing protein [Aliikangiella coralliicola]